MGVVIVYAVMIILLNFLVDMVYGLLDPKLKSRS
jgi:oligopeptide transport system permease protein